MAVVTNNRSPQTTGLECPKPGIAVRHRMFSPVFTFQVSGKFAPSATPEACGPRNDGQLSSDDAARGKGGNGVAAVRTTRRCSSPRCRAANSRANTPIKKRRKALVFTVTDPSVSYLYVIAE